MAPVQQPKVNRLVAGLLLVTRAVLLLDGLLVLTLVFIGSAPHGGCIIKIIEPTAARNQGYSATGYSTLYHFWDLWVLRST